MPSSRQTSIYSGFRNGNGIAFGLGYDLFISDQSNANTDSYSNLGYSYQLPLNYSIHSSNAMSIIAGTFNFKTLEVEVYSLDSNVFSCWENVLKDNL